MKSNLQVTFLKLHSGLFKIASELCTLCGAYVALIIFSHGEKVFSFGHINVETIINRYLSQIPLQNNGILQFIEAYRNAKVRKLNALLTRMNDALDIEKNRCNEFEPAAK
ncbi:putative transcription factor MADS-type1 family [Medicago truncatula]|uniref:MADS-box transcription factor family protein n=1 Tax=Medicago truncatula TaxID=3880 RepID=A0A072UY28_MEDTR|nr:MADS-box transcription factor family protein [Medicago truncatula]RHN68257.1 putative transcription factor MADS-type1 family [Medicago truncatula]